jgi:cyanate permease
MHALETALWRSPLAWQVSSFVGLQSPAFYMLVALQCEVGGLAGRAHRV